MKERARILIVDDDESIRERFTAILEENGYVVDTAEFGKDAIEKSNKNFYNAAFIDIRLPDMEGIELLTALKGTTPKMRKIIVTGYPALQNAIEAVNRNADAYVTKPPKMKEVLSLLKEHLEKQKKEKRLSEEKVAEFIQKRAKEINKEKKSSTTLLPEILLSCFKHFVRWRLLSKHATQPVGVKIRHAVSCFQRTSS